MIGSDQKRISVIVMPTGHLMLADAMALPAGLTGDADCAANAAAVAAAAAAVASRAGPPAPSESINLVRSSDQQPISLVKTEAELPASTGSHDEDCDEGELSLEELSRRPDLHRSVVDGVDLNEIGQFAREFKLRRLRLGLTQTQIGAALSAARGPAYSQSAISRFEKLDVTPRSAARIKQALQAWLVEAEESAALLPPDEVADGSVDATAAASLIGDDDEMKEADRTAATESTDAGSIDEDPAPAADPAEQPPPPPVQASGDCGSDGAACVGSGKRPRKRRTSFTPEALEALNSYFELNRHPSGAEVTQLARALRYSREVIRVWFCNRRQALRANTVKRLRPPVAVTSSAAAAAAVAAAAAAAVAASSSASSVSCTAAASAAGPTSSPSPSDSPVNLCQHQAPAAALAALAVPQSSSPASVSSTPTTPPLRMANIV
ncbi:hypothetical protein BOX15_Mlig006637g1 [Macrostomum lignano]|uniref:POU domain protein n=1 Tax=Macrostomum lignano TaxID=282301 RepID=A0A267DVW8_9PLAT|nr:hypothetical protein BOX15_Mlig006637g3 [Macrostomum lignano]PAA60881.1 hypothetical protein BOX15_Mlig006637g1 [Macrostomum lignano]